jgi:hypothetical protein
MMKANKFRLFASILVGSVFVINIQAGFDFFINPQKFTKAFELAGTPGEISVAGVGLLFIMWNVPYVFAIVNPIKYSISLLQAIIMQLLGVAGETILYLRIPNQSHQLMKESILRFIIFDFAGFILLIMAGGMIVKLIKEQRGKSFHAV